MSKCDLCGCDVDPKMDFVDCSDLGTRHRYELRCIAVMREEIERLQAAIKQAVWEAEAFGKVSLGWVSDARRLVGTDATEKDENRHEWVEIHGSPEAADNLDYKAGEEK